MALVIDTLAYSRRLREAGFSEAQAVVQAEALAAVMNDSIATKHDLQELERHLRLMFSEHSARFDAKLSELGQQLTMRMLLAVGAVSALVRLL